MSNAYSALVSFFPLRLHHCYDIVLPIRFFRRIDAFHFSSTVCIVDLVDVIAALRAIMTAELRDACRRRRHHPGLEHE